MRFPINRDKSTTARYNMDQGFISHCSKWTIQASVCVLAKLGGVMPERSNLFMTWSWYGHLKHRAAKPWRWTALVLWNIARFDNSIQVPAQGIGFWQLGLSSIADLA